MNFCYSPIQIRKKEARTVEMSMMVSPADEKRSLMLARLPAMARTLRTYPFSIKTTNTSI